MARGPTDDAPAAPAGGLGPDGAAEPPGNDVTAVDGGWPLAVGLVMAITLVALELLGVAAAMPVIAEELDGDALYGAVFSAFTVAQIVAIAVAGHVADRRPVVEVFSAGLVLFGVGLALAASAPTMELLVATRVVQGLGAGLISTVVFVAINRAFGPERRPTILAIVSAAWVSPALVAPPVAGWLAEEVSWRWVFAGIVPVVPVVAVLTLGPLRRLGPPRSPVSLRRPLSDGLLVAVGIGLAQLGLSNGQPAILVVVTAVGVVLAVAGVRRVLPPETLQLERPLGAAIWLKILVGAGFFGADFFIPEALTETHGIDATRAALTLTVGSVAWTTGSIIQARTVARVGPRRLAVTGCLVLAAGVVALSGMLDPDLPWWWAMAVWTVTPVGMGLAFNTSNSTAMDHARPGHEGEVSTALTLADMIGVAAATGIGGSLIAAAEREDWRIAAAIGPLLGLTVVSLLAAAAVARRLPGPPAVVQR